MGAIPVKKSATCVTLWGLVKSIQTQIDRIFELYDI